MFKRFAELLAVAIIGSLLGAWLFARYSGPKYVYVNPESQVRTTSGFIQDVADQNVRVPVANPDFEHASRVSRPAVVHIKAEFSPSYSPSDLFKNPFGEPYEEDYPEEPRGMASGSGVLISADGYIVTNNHVVEDARDVEVILFDNRAYKARVIGFDISTDLALLKIEEQDLPFLTFGNSDEVMVGQWVLAVGNPMDLNSTVTAGIVSAKGRNINLLRADSEYAIESFIQTDAAVNKGNSGGALVNLNGDLVGINTAIASRTGYYAGYSFAIPSSIVKKVMEDLLTFGEVRRGFLGVTIQPVDADLSDRLHLSVLKGAYVSGVNTHLGAYDAGIREGDVIISVNGYLVTNASELQEMVGRFRPGDEVAIEVFRHSDKMRFTVALKTLDGRSYLPVVRRTTEFRGNVFRQMSETEKSSARTADGVVVELAGRTMRRAGIRAGFILIQLDGKHIGDIADLEKALISSGEEISIYGVNKNREPGNFDLRW